MPRIPEVYSTAFCPLGYSTISAMRSFICPGRAGIKFLCLLVTFICLSTSTALAAPHRPFKRRPLTRVAGSITRTSNGLRCVAKIPTPRAEVIAKATKEQEVRNSTGVETLSYSLKRWSFMVVSTITVILFLVQYLVKQVGDTIVALLNMRQLIRDKKPEGAIRKLP